MDLGPLVSPSFPGGAERVEAVAVGHGERRGPGQARDTATRRASQAGQPQARGAEEEKVVGGGGSRAWPIA
ncbi:hypothetical protein PR202_gb28428 [Eleusine coracana subsp. coracana]|uniref:Uncharacterized protein n=1 Tax=Eleusine coracana subsp. coracana TaxID=191504 RepID=A0AAV5FWB9_ELECO|nr:hypothetical protein PR202_gb28428 [Eleusine coracana subsp. coracana]